MSATYSSALTAALAGIGDKITYLNTIRTALGPTRTVTFKHAASGDPWSGTTFYAAPVTGAMGISGGALTNLGTVGPHTVRANAVLTSGAAVMRIEGNGAFMQGTVGLAGSTGYDGLPVDFVLRKSPNGAYGIMLNSAKFGAPAHLAAAPDAELALVRMWNTGSSEEAAGFVSPMFGCSFAQGAVPAGTYPYFRVAGGGAVCPATLWGVTSWPDGSMKFCGAMVRVPAAVPAAGYLDISMRSGGDAPAAGTRTTADLAAPDINVQMVGVDGLTGTWTASLNDAIATGALEKLGDGPAGAIWRIGGEVRDGGSAAHGQLYCWHYVAALTNANGSLRGLRYLGRVAQPWIDVATPAPRHRDLQATVRRGSTVIRALQGHTDTETAGSTIRLPHYGSFFTAGSDGKWDYIQGGGSTATDAAIRVTVSAPYLKTTKTVPPFDITNAPTAFASVDYVPMGRGSYVARLMGSTGGRPDIGLWANWCVTHFSDQTALNERILRVNAMLGGSWRISVRRQSTKLPALFMNMPGTYAGMGAVNTASPAVVSPNLSLWAEDGAHFPNPFSWAYAFTGEPQYLDLMQDRAANVQGLKIKGARVFKTTWPITSTPQQTYIGDADMQLGTGGPVYPGAGLMFVAGGIRQAAWALRDVMHAAGFSPEGAQRQYLQDVLASNFAAFRAYTDLAPSTFRDSGLFIMQPNGSTVDNFESPWMLAYLHTAVCAASDLVPSTDATYTRQYLSRFWTAHAAAMDPGNALAYRHSAWDENGTLIESAAQSVFHAGSATIAFTASDSRGTISGANWNPSDGDVFAFNVGAFSSAYPFPSATYNKRFYAVGCSGKTLQLAATPGGTPITVPADVSCGNFFVRAASLPPDVFIHSADYHEIFQGIRGAIGYFAAHGDPGASALHGTLQARAAAKGWPYPSDRFTFAGSRA